MGAAAGGAHAVVRAMTSSYCSGNDRSEGRSRRPTCPPEWPSRPTSTQEWRDWGDDFAEDD